MRILIIEDEARIAKRIERMSREIFGQLLVSIDKCESIEEGLLYLEQHPIDVLLLDLNLNGEDGFTILTTVVAKSFHTIIISAYTEKAIHAFAYGVLDFVPKPFDENRLSQAFARISAANTEAKNGMQYLAIKKAGAISLIDVQDICYIKGAGIYTEIHLQDTGTVLHDKSLEKLEQLLPPMFERIHKSYIVAITQVHQLIVGAGGKYELVLKNGEVLPVGRTRYQQLKMKRFNEE